MLFAHARNQLFLHVVSVFFCDFMASFIGDQSARPGRLAIFRISIADGRHQAASFEFQNLKYKAVGIR